MASQEKINKLLEKPCKRGHSRKDAYVNTNPFDNKTVISCRKCRELYYEKNSEQMNKQRNLLWKEKGY